VLFGDWGPFGRGIRSDVRIYLSGTFCGLRVDRWDDAADVRVRGEVDLAVAPMLSAVLHHLLDEVELLQVDLTAVTLLDAQSIGVLASTHRRAAKTGTTVWVRGAGGRVLRALEITGWDKLCDPAGCELPTGPGQDRTVETVLQARRRTDDEAVRQGLRQLAIGEMYDLAVTLANGYRGRGEPVDDLVQVATVGLLKAVDGYDAERGPGFTAYAVPTITGEIKRHFRDRGWTIRVPRRMQEIGMGLSGARESLFQQLGRSPTVAELAQHLGVTAEEVLHAMEAAQVYRPESLSAPLGLDDGPDAAALVDLLGAPDAGFDLVENRESLRGLVNRLPPRQQRILALRFYGNLTQSQIAEKIGVSQMHVSRLLADALRQLRSSLTDET
jgi:RNA polymerase sigma-B factor